MTGGTLRIRTPQGITFSLLLAGPITRLLALAVDLSCVVLAMQILATAAAGIGWMSTDIATALQILAYVALSIGYGTLTEWLWRGQTIGKRLLRLRVIDEQGLRLQFSQILIRNLLRAVDMLPGLYLVGGMAMLLSRRAQRLGDYAANTVVVRSERVLEPDLDQLLSGKFNSLRVGASDMDLDVGPVINAAQKTRVDSYLDLARRDGLKFLGEGSIAPNVPRDGFYVIPTVIGDVPPDHRLAQEEIFGPVLVAMRFRDEAEALHLANATPYGLVAGIWTNDGGRQLRLAKALKSGQVFINNFGAGGGVELPFGGVKRSGHGREKGFEALFHFSAPKTVAIRHG